MNNFNSSQQNFSPTCSFIALRDSLIWQSKALVNSSILTVVLDLMYLDKYYLNFHHYQKIEY
jgi:hypothetical protein